MIRKFKDNSKETKNGNVNDEIGEKKRKCKG